MWTYAKEMLSNVKIKLNLEFILLSVSFYIHIYSVKLTRCKNKNAICTNLQLYKQDLNDWKVCTQN